MNSSYKFYYDKRKINSNLCKKINIVTKTSPEIINTSGLNFYKAVSLFLLIHSHLFHY